MMENAAEEVIVGSDGLVRPAWAEASPRLHEYYDNEWGVPIYSEQGVFERLALESFQAGLSWRTILYKRPAFRECFYDFDPERVAKMDQEDIERLMKDERIIRNRQKIEATIQNAVATLALRDEGGLSDFVWSFQPDVTPMPHQMSEVPSRSDASEAMAKALKKRGFRFVGPVSMYALMEAIGLVDTHLLCSHRRGCSGLFDPEGRRLQAPTT